MTHFSHTLGWAGFLVAGLALLGLWVSGLIYMLRGRSALLDLFSEVNGKLPHVMRHDSYSMNPLNAFRVWQNHCQFFPQDTGTRHLVKRCGIWSSVALVAFVGVILALVFVGR
jgi:hypothetical protein